MKCDFFLKEFWRSQRRLSNTCISHQAKTEVGSESEGTEMFHKVIFVLSVFVVTKRRPAPTNSVFWWWDTFSKVP